MNEEAIVVIQARNPSAFDQVSERGDFEEKIVGIL